MQRLADFRPLAPRPASASSADDFVARAVDAIPTEFGRLVLLGSLQDKSSGAYQGALAALAFDGGALRDALERHHKKAFHSWLKRDARCQAEDVFWYCHAAGRKAREAAANWIVRAGDYSSLVPSSAGESDQEKFRLNLEQALATAYVKL